MAFTSAAAISIAMMPRPRCSIIQDDDDARTLNTAICDDDIGGP